MAAGLRRVGVVAFVIALVSGAASVCAQGDYPFRNPALGEDQRIADLLHRMTVEEKIVLMSDHPSFARLGLVFSGQVEGLHGLALGGPGEWGGHGKPALPTTTPRGSRPIPRPGRSSASACSGPWS